MILDGMNLFVSVITKIELLGYQNISQSDKIKIIQFLSDCEVIKLNDKIENYCISLKQFHKIKTPDAIIAATAIYLNLPLLTADVAFEKLSTVDSIIFTN